jgi:nicotinamidase-related amidase
MDTTVLLIIDIQRDYFIGGRHPLPGAEAAAAKAAELLRACRAAGMTVIHIRHEFASADAPFFARGSDGASFHTDVLPQEGEVVIIKSRPNAFYQTTLENDLRRLGADRLIVCGMMTNMCVDAAVRAAADLGFACTVIHDACAAADLRFGTVAVPAASVHAAFLAALDTTYATTLSVEEFVRSRCRGR